LVSVRLPISTHVAKKSHPIHVVQSCANMVFRPPTRISRLGHPGAQCVPSVDPDAEYAEVTGEDDGANKAAALRLRLKALQTR
jgi:hypothetical protein